MDDEERRAWIALSLCAMGRPDQWLAFARARGSAASAVAATDDELRALGATVKAIAIFRDAWQHRSARVLERCRQFAIDVATIDEPSFPRVLAEIPCPPLVLFWRGASPVAWPPGLAIVGSRRCTDYGERTALRFAREVAKAGIVVWSGLARGIDAAAHRGALEAGRTAAVLAGGLDQIYPPEHTSLAARIVEKGGCLVSEQPPGERPRPRLFPYRNRVITGLSLATVLVEAGIRSGSLASARHALDQGRDVFVVPGPIDSPWSEGTNGLLTEGAAPLRSLVDLTAIAAWSERFQPAQAKSAKKKRLSVEGLEPVSAAVLTAIHAGSATADEITAATGLDGTRVLTHLTALELDGLVRREAHGRFRVTP